MTIDELQQLRIRIATWSGTNQYGPKRGMDFPDLADCLIGSGGRISEVLAFQWEHIRWATDLSPAMVYLAGAINKRGEYQPRPKTATSQHWLILPDFMVSALQRQKARATSPRTNSDWYSPPGLADPAPPPTPGVSSATPASSWSSRTVSPTDLPTCSNG
ncbi:hypothetical protein QNM97_17240 [Gordonia sp. L191]|uniref:hypothetical protein n=1 Tax=Gordonia sp. L191 TaxID=2982699 RepID=UPI0024BF20C1|nr:hypothetical protein [Gordonia sp. L191]WHU45754.1 hypothetical protein QNM97_17240 [Gordonia sp. L191]